MQDRQHCGRPFLARWPAKRLLQLTNREESKRALTSYQYGKGAQTANACATSLNVLRNRAEERKCSSLCTYGEHVGIFKIFKNEKCAQRQCTDWSMCEKKCDTWAKDIEANLTLTLSIPTMLILMSNFLCVVRIASWRQGIKTKTTITQNFRHQSGPESTISTPPSFSVYETQHDDRLGKNACKKNAQHCKNYIDLYKLAIA